MPNVVLAQLESVQGYPGTLLGTYWRSPGGGQLDVIGLRTFSQRSQMPGGAPQGHALIVYPGPRAHPNFVRDLGSDIERQLTLVERSALETSLGITLVETRLDRIIAEIKIKHGDPAGLTSWKPTRGSRQRGAQIRLNGFGRIYQEPFRAGRDIFENRMAVFQADYRRNVADGSMTDETLRKWTGMEMLQTFGVMSDSNADALIPSEFRLKGWQPPRSSFSDAFTTGADQDLDARTNWVLINGVASNVRVLAANDFVSVEGASADDNLYYNDQALSGDDHFCQEIIRADSSNQSHAHGAMTRKADNTTLTFYFGVARIDVDTVEIFEVTAGSSSSLADTSFTMGIDTDFTLKFNSDSADLHELFIDGSSKISATDSSITGVNHCGLYMLMTDGGVNIRIDDWEATDNAAAGAAEFMAALQQSNQPIQQPIPVVSY